MKTLLFAPLAVLIVAGCSQPDASNTAAATSANAQDPAVAAHTRIIPIRHEQGSIRGQADVSRAEPFVFGAFEDIFDFGFVTGPAFGHRIGANDVWAGIAVDDLVLKDVGQGGSFIQQRSGGQLTFGNLH